MFSLKNPDMYAYLAISGLTSLATWVLLFLPNFLTARGWSLQLTGWAIGIHFLFYLVTQAVAGRIADRIGFKRVAVAGTIISIAGGFLYLGALSVTALIFPARILHAIGSAMIYAGALLQLVQSVPLHLRGRVMGYYGLPGFVMIGLGPMIAEWMMYAWGIKGVFIFIPVCFGISAWLMARLTPHGEARQTVDHSFASAFRAAFHPLRPILLFSVTVGLCFSAWNSFVAPAVQPVGAGGVSAFGLGYAAGAILTRLGLSHMLDKGRRRLHALSTLVPYGVALVLIPHARTVTHLLLLGIVCGMAHGTYFPSLSSIATVRFHPLHTGQAMSLYISASALGQFLGPPLWGAVADAWGYGVMFAVVGGVLVVSAGVFILGLHRLVTTTDPHALGV